jgi:hypothetical protein
VLFLEHFFFFCFTLLDEDRSAIKADAISSKRNFFELGTIPYLIPSA